MARTLRALLVVAIVLTARVALAADISGKWTGSVETPMGTVTYTYDFVVKDSVLTGTAKSSMGESALSNGKVDGNKVTFEELLKVEGMEIKIQYTGTIVSADEIKFVRQVGDFATEELVAKRAK